MGKKRSWVWQYAKRKGNTAFCELCDEGENNEYSCVGGTTGSLIRHLKIKHSINQSVKSTSRRSRYVLIHTLIICCTFLYKFILILI